SRGRRLLSTCDSVARINVDLPDGDCGTGWMLTPELFITCWHVLAPSPAHKASRKSVEERSEFIRIHFSEKPPENLTHQPDVSGGSLVAGVWGDPQLDSVILRIKSKASLEPLPASKTRLKSVPGFWPANIPQYPGGKHLMIGARANRVVSADETYVTYETDTERGSSGAPVCDDSWRVWALHRANGNRGTQMAAILDWLSVNEKTVYDEVAAKGQLD
ncbi:MAG: serine protease, partial [Myxococcota bacterium]